MTKLYFRPSATSGVTASIRRTGLLGLELSSDVEVAASRQRIWDVLTDLSAYGQWNNAIPVARGALVEGGVLDVEIAWPGLKRSPYKLNLLTVAPGQELRWLGQFGMRGLLDGDHRFTLAGPAEGPVRVTQSERFSGLLVPVFAPWLQNNVLAGFVDMNAALRRRAERVEPAVK